MIDACLRYWRLSHRVREAIPVFIGVCGQALCFLCVTLVIDRQRPG